MQENELKILAEKATAIAKQTAEALKHFSKDTAMLMYAMQMQNTQLPVFKEGTEHKKINNKEANLKLNKLMEDANLRWKYAPESDKKKALEMEKIITGGNEEIRKLYTSI